MTANRKFWLAIIVVTVQMAIFATIAIQGKLTDLMVAAFLAAPVATFTAFGILNVTASGQAAKVAIAQAAPGATVENPPTTVQSAAGAEKEKVTL